MKTTNNLGLKKIELSDSPPDITVQDFNWDIIDNTLKEHEDALINANSELAQVAKAEKAAGTATAITLTNVLLTNGSIKNFMVKANNNATATTINGKPLYKPGTTTAPKLKAGTAVAVWYDQTGDCFFIRASAGGGTAVAGDVLAGKTFSNEDDSELLGTMPDRGAVNQALAINGTYNIPAGYHNGSGIVTQSITTKAVATYTPGTTDQAIAANQYLSGTQTIKGDTNLVAANIAKGKTVFNVAGTLDTRQLNFPLSIQDVTPTPVRVGHIWVKSNTLAAQITAVKILEAVNAGETNGTLMFVVGDLALRSMSFGNTVDLTSGGNKDASMADTSSSSADWEVISKTGAISSSYKINRPLVYSKLGGVLDVETSYFWDGVKWNLLCQKGAYLYVTNATGVSRIRIYNKINDSFSFSSQLTENMSRFTPSGDGTYFNYYYFVYKRVGDNVALYFTLPLPMTIGGVTFNNVDGYTMTKNGTFVVLLRGYVTANSNYIYSILLAYKDNGTTFQQVCASPIISTYDGSGGASVGYLVANSNASFVCFLLRESSSMSYTPYAYFMDGASYVRTATSISNINVYVGGISPIKLSYDDKYLFISISSGASLHRCTIDYATKTLNTPTFPSPYNIYSFAAVHPDGYLVVTTGSALRAFRISDMQLCSFNITPEGQNISFNLSGDRMVIVNSTGCVLYSVAISGTVFTLTQITAVTDTSFSINGQGALIPW